MINVLHTRTACLRPCLDGAPSSAVHGAANAHATGIPSALVAMALTAALFALVLGILRPGYWINDDLKIAWLLAGYPGGGGASPFPVYSNALVGLALLPLFELVGSPNWFSILLELINALSTATLFYIGLSGIRRHPHRLMACAMLVLAVGLLILEVTYTVTAFLASFSGICLVWASLQHPEPSRNEALVGSGLIVLGSLIRLEMLPIAAAVAVPGFLLEGARRTRFLVWLACGGLAVLGTYGFSRLYVRANPEWNAFYAYSRVRGSIHDSHRLFNVHAQIRRVGWTPNDQELFARWFFPDPALYSYDHLRYLEQNVSPYSRDLVATVGAWLKDFVGGRNTPYVVSVFGTFLLALALGLSARTHLALVAALLAAFGVNAGFAFWHKDPDYVQACTLAACLMMCGFFVGRQLEQHPGPLGPGRRPLRIRGFVGLVGTAVATGGAAMMIASVLSVSQTNAAQAQDYARIRSDFQAMVRHGILAETALIISPAHGLPYEWSNPFELDRPLPAYLDTGWITFSPSYLRSLMAFDVGSSPEALLDSDKALLMTQKDLVPFLSRYYAEHYDLSVEFDVVYHMPNPHHWPDYDNIFIYRLRR